MAENYFGITDPGKKRSNNEDCFIAEFIPAHSLIAVAVIDGLGGYEGGEVAAKMAQQTIINHLKNSDGSPIKSLTEALVLANNTISDTRRTNKQYNQMACVATLALADLSNNKFYYAHVGDTRLYLLRDRSLVKITKDQSFVGFLEDNGKISEDDAMRHPKRNEINKALGFDASIDNEGYIETGESPFLPGDCLLLCSDGLSDMIHSNTMTEILIAESNIETKAKQLVDAANDAGGDDNITVVLVHNNNAPQLHTATKPIKKSIAEPVVAATPAVEEAVNTQPSNGNKRTLIILSVLLAILLAAFGWMFYKNYVKSSFEAKSYQVQTMDAPPNAIEQLLADTINAKSLKAIVLNKKNNGDVVFTRPIMIDIDSVSIKGNGVSLVSDTAYHGAAFEIGPHCKYFFLDSLLMENFETGILVKKRGLVLKNVRFVNCNIPVQYQFMFPPARYISGSIADSVFRKDSIPK